MNPNPIGKVLIIAGLAIVILGVAFLFLDKIPFIGKLPGDITIRKKDYALFFPLGTSIAISLLLTAVLYIISLFRK